MIGELTVVSGLIPADQARDAGRKQHALFGKRVGARAEATAAVADMAPDIKSGPVIDGSERGCLERQVSGGSGIGERNHAKARECVSVGAAAAVHAVIFSSANILANSFFIADRFAVALPPPNQASAAAMPLDALLPAQMP